MKNEVSPILAGGIVLGIIAVIGLVILLRGTMGQPNKAQNDQRNTQIINQMRNAGATSQPSGPQPGTMMAPPPPGGMAPGAGGMAPPPPGGMAPAPAPGG